MEMHLIFLCRNDELRQAHSAFQTTFDKEKRREAERKAELDRQRRVEVPLPTKPFLCTLCLPFCRAFCISQAIEYASHRAPELYFV